MPAPSAVYAARNAPNARSLIYRMARIMKEAENGPEGACTVVRLFQAGFTEAQVVAYRDPARALIQGLDLGLKTSPPGRREAEAAIALIRERRFIRAEARYRARRAWAAPMVEEKATSEEAA